MLQSTFRGFFLICCLVLPGLQGNVAVEHPAVVKLCLVCARACVCPLAPLTSLAPGWHGLPLQADLRVGRWTRTSAGMGWRGRRGQWAKCELSTWTAGQLYAEREAEEEGGRDRGEINTGLLGVQYHKLEIKTACKLTVYCYCTD